MNAKSKKVIKELLIYILFPVFAYLIFSLIVYIKSGTLFLSNTLIFNNYIRSVVLAGLLALAVSLGIPNGRFDFSIGSIMVLSIIVASNLAVKFGLGSFLTLVLFIICGAVLGAVSGLIYVLLKLRAMVTSIGVMLIYEAFTVIVFGGKGFNDYKALNQIYGIVNNNWTCALLLCSMVAICYVLRRYTKFGYNMRSIRGGQRIAVDAGINEKKNAIGCYILAGVITAIAGMVYSFQLGGFVEAQSGMSTIGLMFQGFLAMMIGELLERWGDFSLAIFVGAIIAPMYLSFLMAIGLSNNAITLVNAFTLLLFLITNKYFDRIIKLFNWPFKQKKAASEA